MLAAAIGNYIDSLTEREFDTPFIALLRLHGFTFIHFLHRSFEFGKDFIAKLKKDGVEYQYAFQTKAGDLGLSDWRACRGQIDMLRTNALTSEFRQSDAEESPLRHHRKASRRRRVGCSRVPRTSGSAQGK